MATYKQRLSLRSQLSTLRESLRNLRSAAERYGDPCGDSTQLIYSVRDTWYLLSRTDGHVPSRSAQIRKYTIGEVRVLLEDHSSDTSLPEGLRDVFSKECTRLASVEWYMQSHPSRQLQASRETLSSHARSVSDALLAAGLRIPTPTEYRLMYACMPSAHGSDDEDLF